MSASGGFFDGHQASDPDRAAGVPQLPANVEMIGTEGSDLPFAALDEWPDQDLDTGRRHYPAEDDLRASLRGSFVHTPEPMFARLRRAMRGHMRRSQEQGLYILQLLTCNVMVYFYEHLSPRNVVFLLLSSGVFLSTWLSLEPCDAGWALGILYVFSASTRMGSVEPLWAAVMALLGQLAFDLAPSGGVLRWVLWRVLGALGALSEVCWWPSSKYLIESSFHMWIVHFSTYYAVIIDFWVWPQLLQVDPEKWHITKIISQAPEETKDAIIDMSAGLLLIIGIPVLACTVIAIIIIWHRSPRLCIVITVVYLALISLLLIFRNASTEQAADIGQVPIATIFVALAREQLANAFDDLRTWKGQAALLAGFIALRQAARVFLAKTAANQVQVVIMLIFQIVSKQWMAAQCSALHIGLPSSLCLSAWLPRRSSLLFGSDEVHGTRLILERRASPALLQT